MEFSPHNFIGNFGLLVMVSSTLMVASHMNHEDDLGGIPIHVLIMANVNFMFAMLLFALAEGYRLLNVME